VPIAHPIKPRVLTGAHQITRRLQLTRGNMDRLEQPAGEQPRQLARVTAVRLDPVTRPLRYQPGATTAQSIPRPTKNRCNPKPVGPAS